MVNGWGPRRGVGVALSFLVEGQQRHVHRLDDLLLNPRNNHCYHPFVTAFVTAKTPFVTAKPTQTLRVLGNLSTSLNGEGPLVKHTSLSAFDWTGSYGPPFRGGASAPAGKPQPLFHT